MAASSPERRAWLAARARCTNPQHPGYPQYGGRGITMCTEWLSDFAAFFSYIGPRPSNAYSLDRFPDPCGPYAPGNVRWATRSQQMLNQRPRIRWAQVQGQRFGRLIAVTPAPGRNNRTVSWVCQCDCGTSRTVRIAHLRAGSVRSCGCLRRERMSAMRRAQLVGHRETPFGI